MPRVFFFLLVAAALFEGCNALPEPAAVADLTPLEEKGWRVFEEQSCFPSCHLYTIASAKPGAPDGFVPDLRKTARRTRDWYLAYFVDPRAVLPWSPMTSYGYLSKDEIEALIAFLQGLNRDVVMPSPEPIAPEEIPEAPRNLAAYDAGRTIYRTYCEGCHGESGNGGGRVGHLLSPEPRDFTDAIWMSKQAEDYLFSIVTNGKANTAMPAFKDILKPQERALALRYVGYFADPVARERMELGFIVR